MAKIYGTARGEYLQGTEFADVIAGKGGDDSIWDDSGGDKIYGDDGNDGIDTTIDAYGNGPINSFVSGGNGNDTITNNGVSHGDAGNDNIVSYSEGFLYGEAGNDTLRGAGYINGGSGSDRLTYDPYCGRNTTMVGGTGRDNFQVDVVNQTKIIVHDFHHSEGDKFGLTFGEFITDDGGRNILQTSAQLFNEYDADKNGKHDGVIRIGDHFTAKAPDGDLQLRLHGSIIEFDGVHTLAASD